MDENSFVKKELFSPCLLQNSGVEMSTKMPEKRKNAPFGLTAIPPGVG